MSLFRRLLRTGVQYFFSKAGVVYDPDNEGLEFEPLDRARIEAVRYAAEVMRGHPTLVGMARTSASR